MQHTEPILKTAIHVFGDINNRIQSLIECSARDFDILNHNFKEYHKKINSLSELTNKLVNELTEIPDEKVSKSITIVELNEKLIRDLSNNSNDLLKSLNLIDKGITYAFLYMNNLKQNNSTLRLLVTNIQFDPKYRRLYKSLLQDMENLSKCSVKLEQEFSHLEKRNNFCRTAIERIVNHQLPAVHSAENRFGNELSQLAARKSKSEEFKKSLEKLKAEKKVMSSEIITNLQFQDIIRQKIEHVQIAHEHLLQKLDELLNLKNGKKTQKLSVEVLARIKDIGALQAAQLIHANHEYQNAIENITEKFRMLDNIMAETLSLLQHLTDNADNAEEFKLRHADKIFGVLELETETLISENKELLYNYTDLLRKKESLVDSQDQIDCILANLEEITSRLEPEIRTEKASNSLISPLQQLLTGIEEFRNNARAINEIISKEKLNLNMLSQDTVDAYFRKFTILENNMAKLNESSNVIVHSKNLGTTGLTSIINDELQSESRFSIDQVKYYKVFDQEVEDIINKLNELINQIDFDDLRSESTDEELAKLKDMYTMESERKVHDLITGTKSATSNNENDVELF